ncbi:queuosine salvage family protein [Sandaracinobacteroides saxicola]|uniref:Queuosine 5'-phosphate N-glycosylase/hydrolase n=1 Tax=Sandaracinobacteroides saxicola TaxID=2759707 RepID=A0A7G5IE59_9SPHN|nr:queuosine salvage family protein [Sandaracinobacteroides saxicola]QMW21651.1 hypothetical protein H3309_09470 [Sandaracinobacteroides saxicola]
MTDSPQTVLRRSAQALAGRTRHVSVRTDRLEAYLEEVARRDQQQRYDPAPDETSSAEERVSFVLLRDATNFGSGWHPHLNKEPGISGARTTGVRLARWLAENGVPSAEQLSKTTAEHCAIVFGQSMTEPVAELMALFADAWRQLGEALGNRFGGSYGNLVAAADRSAVQLTALLGEVGYFNDVYIYDGLQFPFLKRAQLAAYDLSLFCPGDDRCRFHDLDQLTIFADNLVPHTLRVDGVLEFDATLLERIDRGELIAAGSPEEIEIRAMAVHATELLSAMSAKRGDVVMPLRLSDWIWNRGQSPLYKARPRQRTRSVHY